MKLNESAEMYLETILLLKKSEECVKSIDIANKLDVSRPSVSRAVKKLKDQGYINISEEGCISFTQTGRDISTAVYNRHIILSKFLQSIGVAEKTADKDACKIEHVISEESFQIIKKKVEDSD